MDLLNKEFVIRNLLNPYKKRHCQYFNNDLDIRVIVQMAKVENCALTNVGELPFDFYAGACNTFSFGALLCFPYNHNSNEVTSNLCHS